MAYLFDPPPRPALAVHGTSDLFPVRRVFCVGRNYRAHTREMGGDPDRDPPLFFGKPADAVVPGGGRIPYPPATSELHHEVELVVALGGGGTAIAPGDALALVWGYGVGIDLTRRDLQAEAKRAGGPWDMSKGFDRSAPVGPLTAAESIGHPSSGRIELSVNGDRRQDGDLADQIWSVPETLAHLSRLVALAPGDLLFTGTPEGVGPLVPGDRVEAAIAGVGTLEVEIVR